MQMRPCGKEITMCWLNNDATNCAKALLYNHSPAFLKWLTSWPSRMETLIARFPSLYNDMLLMHPTKQAIHYGAD